MRNHAAKRDINETAIIHALLGAGATVHQMSAPGMPDLLVGYRKETYLVECKSKGGKLTPAQATFISGWLGRPVIVAYSAEEALRGIGAIA